jgi:hypothetical protein
MPDEGAESYPPELRRALGVTTSALGVGLLVIGIQFLETCATTVNSSDMLVCSYPLQGYGLWFLFFSGVAAIVSANLFAGSILPSSAKGVDATIRYMRSAVLAMGFAFLALIFAFILNVL